MKVLYQPLGIDNSKPFKGKMHLNKRNLRVKCLLSMKPCFPSRVFSVTWGNAYAHQGGQMSMLTECLSEKRTAGYLLGQILIQRTTKQKWAVNIPEDLWMKEMIISPDRPGGAM